MILGSNITAGSGDSRIGAFTNLGAVFNILSLVSDAVAGYDMDGNIILANENLADLCGLTRQQLIGIDVRSMLLPQSGLPSRHGEWPFPMDGSEVLLYCRKPNDGTLVPVAVRAKPLGETDCFVLTVRATDSVQLPVAFEPPRADVANIADVAADRDIMDSFSATLAGETPTVGYGPGSAEPARILRELAGAVSTGDTTGVHELLSDEMCEAIGADCAALYAAEGNGFQLRGMSCSDSCDMPALVDVAEGIAALAIERSASVAFDRAPKGAEPEGSVATVELVDKSDGSAYGFPASQVPPLASFYVVPVPSAPVVVGFSVVGWKEPHPLSGHDAKVLDILAYHHANELMTAAASAYAESSEQLQDVSSDLWMRLEEKGDNCTIEDYYTAFERLAAAIGCELLPVYFNKREQNVRISVPEQGVIALPFTHNQLAPSEMDDGVTVYAPTPESEFAQWLLQLDVPRTGFIVDIDRLAGSRRSFVVCRKAGEEPLDTLEVTLYKRFVQDVHRSERRQNQYAQDTYIARTLQTGMGNTLQAVDGLTARATYNSATETANVGGDFYELIQLPDDRACIILGDVAGKGVQSASVSAAVRTALGAYAWEGLMPAHMVRSLNDFFMSFSRLETFATLFVAIVDLKTGLLTYCSAGHPPAMLLHPQNGTLELLNVQSGVVGAFREMIYRDGRVRLQPGDTLVLYTDGVTEARKPDGTFFGEIGLRDTLVKSIDASVNELPEKILSDLYDFTENRMDDDVALMAVRYDGLADRAGVGLSAEDAS